MVKRSFKSPNCNDNGLETEILRDLFTANMTNDELQKDLLAETKTPQQVFDYSIRGEKGLENQIQIRKQDTSVSSSIQTRTKPNQLDSYREEETKNEIINGAIEATCNHNEVISSVR